MLIEIGPRVDLRVPCLLLTLVCACRYALRHGEARGETKALFLSAIHLGFLKQYLLLAWSSPIKLRWLASEPQESACLLFPSAGTLSLGYPACFFFPMNSGG